MEGFNLSEKLAAFCNRKRGGLILLLLVPSILSDTLIDLTREPNLEEGDDFSPLLLLLLVGRGDEDDDNERSEKLAALRSIPNRLLLVGVVLVGGVVLLVVVVVVGGRWGRRRVDQGLVVALAWWSRAMACKRSTTSQNDYIEGIRERERETEGGGGGLKRGLLGR